MQRKHELLITSNVRRILEEVGDGDLLKSNLPPRHILPAPGADGTDAGALAGERKSNWRGPLKPVAERGETVAGLLFLIGDAGHGGEKDHTSV
jgi:hypothetical protein